MATLQNIRNRGALVAAVVGFALVAFILGDFLNQSTSLFGGSDRDVAEIRGNSVTIEQYQYMLEHLTNVYKAQQGQIDAATDESIKRQQILMLCKWNYFFSVCRIRAEYR